MLKQHRGHSGIGLAGEWADAKTPWPLVKVRHAQRGREEGRMILTQVVECISPYFEVARADT